MLIRKPDWDSRLDHFLLACAHVPFRFGQFDCCLFVAGCVYAMTETDLAARYRGQYHSRSEALALAKRHSGSLREFLGYALADLPQIPVPCAQRGDIVLVRRSRDVSLGIVSLDGRTILAAAKEGFLRLSRNLGVRAWRV